MLCCRFSEVESEHHQQSYLPSTGSLSRKGLPTEEKPPRRTDCSPKQSQEQQKPADTEHGNFQSSSSAAGVGSVQLHLLVHPMTNNL